MELNQITLEYVAARAALESQKPKFKNENDFLDYAIFTSTMAFCFIQSKGLADEYQKFVTESRKSLNDDEIKISSVMERGEEK